MWRSDSSVYCKTIAKIADAGRGGGTDEGKRDTGQNRGGRREIMTGEKGGVIGRENKQNKK